MSALAFFRRLIAAATAPDAPAAPAPNTKPNAAAAPAAAAGNPSAPVAAPAAPRLNRNALTILAAIAFMAVVSVVVFVQPTPQAPRAGEGVTPPVTPGTYLDQPVRGAAPAGGVPAVPTGPNPATAPVGLGPNGLPAGAAPGAGGSAPALAPGYGSAGDPTAAYAAAGYPNAQVGPGGVTVIPSPSAAEAAYAASVQAREAGGAAAPPRPLSAAERRALAFRRALAASAAGGEEREDLPSPSGSAPGAAAVALAPGFGPGAAGAGAGGDGLPGVPGGVLPAGYTAGYAPGAGAAGGGGPEAFAEGAPSAPAAPAGRYGSFLASAAQRTRTVQALTLDPAPGRYAVQAGTVIPAILMTEINSDLPGECLAQITRDVYDSRTQRMVLIPRGSKLLCKYDDQLGAGQSRLLVAWTRVLLPDGRSMQLPGLPATDQAGARGVSDQVDRHTRKAFGTAAALSLFSAGLQLSQPRNGSVLAAPTNGQIIAGALGQELNQVGVQMLRRDLMNQQTIRIRQGTQFNVFLNTDLVFPGPYTAVEPPAPAARAAARYFGVAQGRP